MLNVHLLGGEEMIKAAKEARDKENPSALIIGVSLLTSHSDASLEYLGLKNRVNAVKNLAKLAEKCSIHGIVCSPSDISVIKDSLSNLIYVTPGIRLNDDNDDHAQIYTPKKALSLGSDYLVIGRPITDAKEPMEVVKKIISTI